MKKNILLRSIRQYLHFDFSNDSIGIRSTITFELNGKKWQSDYWSMTYVKLTPRELRTCDTNSGSVNHQFMALKWVGKLNGYHLPTLGRKYKSSYQQESIHWDLSSDGTKFSYWHMKGYFFKGYILHIYLTKYLFSRNFTRESEYCVRTLYKIIYFRKRNMPMKYNVVRTIYFCSTPQKTSPKV